jgi:phenylalanyl-tRNA synthetase beta subunit
LKDHLEQIERLKKEIEKQQKEYDGLIINTPMTDKEKRMRLELIPQLEEILRLESNLRPKIERTVEDIRKRLNEEGWK